MDFVIGVIERLVRVLFERPIVSKRKAAAYDMFFHCLFYQVAVPLSLFEFCYWDIIIFIIFLIFVSVEIFTIRIFDVQGAVA